MKRRAALNRQAAGVSLFPFLAVLLCTMGALIVVLVVIARQAHLQVASAARQAETAAADGALAVKQSDLEWRISELSASRDQTRRQLADKQLELSHIEEHARRLRDQLDELAKARAGLSEAAGGDAREGARLRADLERLQHNAAALRLEVSKLTNNGNGQETYAILPYSGPNETRRRPIYIECRAGAIVLQPDGVVLTERDFAVDTGPSNPLASALRAARDYYVNNGIRGRGEQGNPYPLLIIRPDGIREQEVARLAIMSWGGDFGYELVAQDWPLEYPPPDPLLSAAMRQAVSEGRARQAYIASAAPTLMRGHRHSSGVYRASPHGGVMQADGSPVGDDGAMGGMSGRRYRRPIGAGGNGPGSGTGLAGYRPGGGYRPGVGAGGTSSSGGGDDNPYLDAIKQDERAAEAGGRGSPDAGGRATGGATEATGGRDGIGGIGSIASAGSGPWVGQEGAGGGKGDAGPRYSAGGGGVVGVGGGGVGNGSGSTGGVGTGDVGPRYSGGVGAAGTGQVRTGNAGGTSAAGNGKGDVGPRYAGGGGVGGLGVGAGGEGAAPSAGQPGPGGYAGQPTDFKPSASTPGSATAGGGLTNGSASGTSASSPGGSAAGTGSNRAGRPNNQFAGRRTGTATGGTTSGNGDTRGGAGGDESSTGGDSNAYRSGSSTGSYNRLAGGGARGGSGRSSMSAASSGGSPSSQGSSSSSSSASSSAAGGASGIAGQSGAQSSPGGMPMPMMNFGQAGQQSIAAQRGQKNWANPDAGTISMPIERPIHMVCDSEHLTMLPETGGLRGMKVIRLGPRTETSVDDLVSAVWDRIDSWGVAGHGMYWRPRLQMIVEPGGQRRYTELQALLADSGFDVHGKPRTRETAMAPPAESSSAPAGDRSRPKARIRRLRSAR